MEFVKEGLVFTGEDSPKATLMLSVTGAFAELERGLIRERQLKGRALPTEPGGRAEGALAREFEISCDTL